MRYYFTESEKSKGENTAELEDLLFEGDYVEDIPDSARIFRSVGRAVVENEVYNDFEILITLPKNISIDFVTASGIFNTDWEEYDYTFSW